MLIIESMKDSNYFLVILSITNSTIVQVFQLIPEPLFDTPNT